MKVLHCINSLKTYGGAEKIVDKIIKSNKEHEVYEVYDQIDSLNIWYKIVRFFISSVKIIFLSKKYDIVHFHLFPAFYLSLFVLARKVIIHEHNTHNRRRNVPVLRFFERFLYRRALKVICISNATKNNLHEWCGSERNLFVVENFTRFDFLDKSSLLSKKQNNQINIVMVASFTKQKRQKDLIEAMVYLPSNYVCHFLGDGPMKSELIDLSKKVEPSGRVFFYGNVENVADYYILADLCVLLSNWEGFGMVVVEAASHNKLTLVSNVPGLNSLAYDERMIVDNDMSPYFLAEKIKNTYDISISEKKNISNYCRVISDVYSFSEYMKKLNNLYGM